MRVSIPNLSPLATEWQDGRKLVASSWSSVDDVDPFGARRRTISHYDTVMGEFIDVAMESGPWSFYPFSVGHGSVSDQNGMNTLFKSVNSEIRFHRNGVPRYSVGGKKGNPIALSYDRNRRFGNFVANHNGIWSRAN
jgi:hypothetical protein